jgi:hypothetical protein
MAYQFVYSWSVSSLNLEKCHHDSGERSAVKSASYLRLIKNDKLVDRFPIHPKGSGKESFLPWAWQVL